MTTQRRASLKQLGLQVAVGSCSTSPFVVKFLEDVALRGHSYAWPGLLDCPLSGPDHEGQKRNVEAYEHNLTSKHERALEGNGLPYSSDESEQGIKRPKHLVSVPELREAFPVQIDEQFVGNEPGNYTHDSGGADEQSDFVLLGLFAVFSFEYLVEALGIVVVFIDDVRLSHCDHKDGQVKQCRQDTDG